MASADRVESTATRRGRWVAIAVAVALATVALIGSALAVARWRPMWAIRWAPQAAAITLVGYASDGQAEGAVAAASARYDGSDERVKSAAIALLDRVPGRWSRRGAWRVLGGDVGPWRDEALPWRESLVPRLTDADPAVRDAARAIYRGASSRNFELRFLARAQRADGAWPGASSRIAPGYVPDDTGVTAMALLAFAGAGYDHRMPSAYKRRLTRALAWLLTRQDAEGAFTQDARDHARAATALGELFAMTDDAALREPLARAVAVAARACEDADPLAVVLAVMALKSAQAAGLPVTSAMERARAVAAARWATAEDLLRAWRDTLGVADATLADAQALHGILDVFLRRGSDPGAMAHAAADAAGIALTAPVDAWSPLLLDWATIVVFQVGSGWTAWSGPMRAQLFDRQRLGDDATEGSWDPPGGDERDRVAVTACHASTLEIQPWRSPVVVTPTPAPTR